MDWQIRIALILAGIIIIGFIYYDFYRRKKIQTEKQKFIEKMHSSAERVDPHGFDIDGVGSARIASTANSGIAEKDSSVNLIEEPYPTIADSSSIDLQRQSEKPVKTSAPAEKKSSPVEQLSMQDFEQPSRDNDQGALQQSEPDLVISLILRAETGASFKGKDFMPLLLSQGLRHGEMGIFHRHVLGSSGKPGPVLYSVANAINPGTFDLNNIEQFTTPAFAFFMTVPGPSDPIGAFEGMVKTIKLLKSELSGQILDASKSVYTEQTHQHQLESLKEYLIKASIKF